MITAQEAREMNKHTEDKEVWFYLDKIEEYIKSTAEHESQCRVSLIARFEEIDYNKVLDTVIRILRNNGFKAEKYDHNTKFDSKTHLKLLDISWSEDTNEEKD